MTEILMMGMIGAVADGFLVGGGHWLQQRWETIAKEQESQRLAEEKQKLAPRLTITLHPDKKEFQGPYKPPLIRYHLGIQNMNRDSVPILKLNVDFNFRNVIAEVRAQFLFPSGGQMSVEGVEMYKYGKDGLEESYVEPPHRPELNKKFSFEIQKATLNKKIKNLNFADLYVERWDEQQSLFISDIVVDVSKEPPP